MGNIIWNTTDTTVIVPILPICLNIKDIFWIIDMLNFQVMGLIRGEIRNHRIGYRYGQWIDNRYWELASININICWLTPPTLNWSVGFFWGSDKPNLVLEVLTRHHKVLARHHSSSPTTSYSKFDLLRPQVWSRMKCPYHSWCPYNGWFNMYK